MADLRTRPDRLADAAEAVGSVVAAIGAAAPTNPEVADAVFVQPPSEWAGESFRLLAQAGLALWPWPACRPESERETQHKKERKRVRLANRGAGGGTGEAYQLGSTGR